MLSRLLPFALAILAVTLLTPNPLRPQDLDPTPKFAIAFVPYSLVKDIPHSGGGKNTSVTFENRLATEIKLWWVDGGGARHSYGSLEAGKTKTQGSYAQHVWLITDLQDKPLGYFVASSAAAVAQILPTDL